jgi:hypothetical protein
MSSSQPAVASACTARKSTSPSCWPAKSTASKKSTRAFGASASCTMIWDTSTWSRPCNLSTTPRDEVVTRVLGTFSLPMSPVWTYLCLGPLTARILYSQIPPFSNAAGNIPSSREEGPEGLHLQHLRSSWREMSPSGRQCRSVKHTACPSHISRDKICLDLPVHTSCTRGLPTI